MSVQIYVHSCSCGGQKLMSSSFFWWDLWLTLELDYFSKLTSSFLFWWAPWLTLVLHCFARVIDLQTTRILPSLSVLGFQVHNTLSTLAFKWMSRVRLRFLCLWRQPFLNHLCTSHFTLEDNTVLKYNIAELWHMPTSWI